MAMDDPHPHPHPHHHHHNNRTSISFLTKGSQVEVSSHEDGFNGAWYVATVIYPPPSISSPNHHTSNNLVYVEYHNLLSEDGSSNRLREYANISYVRPSPVPDTNPPNFQLNDLVDAFYRDGWWTGVITTVVDVSNFVVTFRNPPDEIQFRSADLRIHKKWIGGRWVQPQKQVTAGWMFSVGKKVEVSFEKESLRDVWFPATVLKNSGNSTFLVEYQQPGAGEEAIFHKVTVDYHHIRPSPPYLRDKNFVLLEKVDACYDFGWWCGVITKKLAGNRYNVFFKHTKKEREFIYSRVRPHMEWKGGKWFNTSQDDPAVRTTHSLIDNQIEQANPIIDKQSPVATSIMKRKRQKDLDSNDKTSTKDETMKYDSSKKKKHPSNGQSEGFDSEVNGMIDQPPSKTENLSHGKKGGTDVRTTHSLIANEQATCVIGKQPLLPTIILKRRRQKNLHSNGKTSPNDEIVNEDSSKKETPPSVGLFFDSEVSGMADHAFSKTDNLSHGKKVDDMAVRTTHSLIDNQIEQATPIIDEQSPVATSIVERKTQKHIDSNDKTSPDDEIKNDDSSKKKKHSSDGQSEGFDSEGSGMTDQAYSKTENLSHGKKVHSKREKIIELKTSKTNSSKKRGRLSNELKSLQASTKGLEVGLFRRTKRHVAKIDATKNFPLVVMGLQCNAVTVSQGKTARKLSDEKTSNVAKSDTTQPDIPLAPLTVVDQEESEGDAASVVLKKKRGRPPKTPVEVNHEIESVVPSTLSGEEAGQRKEDDVTTSSGTKSLEENQGLVNEQTGLAGKQNVPLKKDKLPNESAGQDLHVRRARKTKKHLARKGKRGWRRTISVNTESPAQVSQDASKEKADGSLEKDSTGTSPEVSVGKSPDTMPDDQPISRRFEGNHSPVTIHGPEGTVEQPSKSSEGLLDSGTLPFIRSKALWKTLESMEAFRKLPQKPHFRQLLEGVKEGAREGLAIGAMVTFSTVVDQTCSLRFDDPRSTIEDCLETLVELENNGFDVEVISERLTGLLLIKDKHEELEERSKGFVEEFKENNIQEKEIEEEINEINRQMRELEERRKQALLKKEKRISETGAMEAVIEGIKQEIREVGAEFDELAAAPFMTNNI